MTAPVAELRLASTRYGRHFAVVDVSLALRAGEIVGLLGRNGAGKTTILRLMAGLLSPSAGEVCWSSDPQGCSVAVHYFAGERTLPPEVRAGRWLRLWGAPCSSTNRPLGLLSRGARQRVGLEAVLAETALPGLILLDEPWESLDPEASGWLSEVLAARRSSGNAILVSSHRLHELSELCNRCIFVAEGRVVSEFPVDRSGPGDPSVSLRTVFNRA
jgi:ABC-type multidrug transport system ATPase subunit